jgi:hypothetical protein
LNARDEAPSQRSGRSLRLFARTRPVRRLSPGERDALWAIFARYYADVRREAFERDLDRKQDIILLHDSGDRSLQGFSTLEVYRRALGGRRFVAVYSGDTIIEEAYWGQSALQRAFVRYLLRTWLRTPWLPAYWFLISKGYKTYLLLARNFPGHWPRAARATPPRAQAILDLLARDKFGEAYADGILRFDVCPGRLKEGVAPIDPSLLADPAVRFFVQRNPGHARGDELCCLGEVGPAFPAYFAARQVAKGLARIVRRFRKLWSAAVASS